MIDHFVARFVASMDPFSLDQPSNASFFVVNFMPWLVSQEHRGSSTILKEAVGEINWSCI
jgi:hypothetical protein